MVGLTVAIALMLAAGQVVVKDKAVGNQLAARLPRGHLYLAAAAPVASAVELPPPGHFHLAVAAPVASAEALLPPRPLHLAAAVPAALAVVVLPPGLLHLAVSPTASLRQWRTSTPWETRTLL